MTAHTLQAEKSTLGSSPHQQYLGNMIGFKEIEKLGLIAHFYTWYM